MASLLIGYQHKDERGVRIDSLGGLILISLKLLSSTRAGKGDQCRSFIRSMELSNFVINLIIMYDEMFTVFLTIRLYFDKKTTLALDR